LVARALLGGLLAAVEGQLLLLDVLLPLALLLEAGQDLREVHHGLADSRVQPVDLVQLVLVIVPFMNGRKPFGAIFA
jgi:hypothetical protein